VIRTRATQTRYRRHGRADIDRFAYLIFLSYRFSQGGIGTQNRMLLWLEANCHPSIFDLEHRDALLTATHQRVGAVFLSPSAHPATAVPWSDSFDAPTGKTDELVVNELAALFDRFTNHRLVAGFDATPVAIAESVIAMDLDYLTRHGGRAGDSEELMIRVGPYRRDPFDSVFVRHALAREASKSTEFDQLFGLLATTSVISEMSATSRRALADVLDIYEDRHPNADRRRHRSVRRQLGGGQ